MMRGGHKIPEVVKRNEIHCSWLPTRLPTNDVPFAANQAPPLVDLASPSPGTPSEIRIGSGLDVSGPSEPRQPSPPSPGSTPETHDSLKRARHSRKRGARATPPILLYCRAPFPPSLHP